MALAFACLSALCFGTALVTAKIGLRGVDARSGAAISIPVATLLFLAASPFALSLQGFSVAAGALFAAVGVFFPALVTLLTFQSNDRLGPSVTSSISSTAPLFALAAAAVFLDEKIPARALLACCGVVAGVVLLSWRGAGRAFPGRSLWLPVAGAMLRGAAQVLAKAALLLWPNPFAASLIGYVVSSGTVIALRRGNEPRPRTALLAFVATGALNGAAVLLMYAALNRAPVSSVAPIVAAYPVLTALLGPLVLREERPSARVLAGAVLIAAAIAFLVSGT
ncbi:MAG TPA: DMT family transporter [Burkholderiales bacterium]